MNRGNRAAFEPGTEGWVDSREWRGSFSAVPLAFESLVAHWSVSDDALVWSCPFVLPPWLMHWWNAFGAGHDPLLWEIRDGDRLLGIAVRRAYRPGDGKGQTRIYRCRNAANIKGGREIKRCDYAGAGGVT